MKYYLLLSLFYLLHPLTSHAWGFFGHRQINRMAVFTLPPEMIGFYKYYIVYITENATNPDNRRYVVEGEAPRHFIDADVYDKYYGGKGQAILQLPRYWKQAVERFSEDTLMAYGIVPWHIEKMKRQLVQAFKIRDSKAILRISTDLAHYIADANVPLHTTENYNGQLSNQNGIHGFWESRLPELFAKEYNFFVGQAQLIDNTQLYAWEAVIQAHAALDSVLHYEKELTQKFGEKKYAFEQRNGQTIRTYSRDFSTAYHKILAGQVERQMRKAIKMVGDLWYTAWIEAGSPEIFTLTNEETLKKEIEDTEEEKKQWQQAPLIPGRPHETTSQECCCNDENILQKYQAYYLKRKEENNE